MKGGDIVSIGDKLEVKNPIQSISIIDAIIPVQYKDNNEEIWYEVCEPTKTNLMALIGKDEYGEEVSVIIERNGHNSEMLSDLL